MPVSYRELFGAVMAFNVVEEAAAARAEEKVDKATERVTLNPLEGVW